MAELHRHRELVRRKWTYRAKCIGRPPIDPELQELLPYGARTAGFTRMADAMLAPGVT